jgi:tetratricopeptide (TPR) repeat protein
MRGLFLGACVLLALQTEAKADDRSACVGTDAVKPKIEACNRMVATPGRTGNALSEAYSSRAGAFLKLGDLDNAIIDLETALKVRAEKSGARPIEEDLAAAYRSRGYTAYLAGDFTKATTDLSKAISIWPKDALAYAYRAYAYEWSGNTEKVAEDVENAVRLEAMWKGFLSPGKSRVPFQSPSSGYVEFLISANTAISLSAPHAAISLSDKFDDQAIRAKLKGYELQDARGDKTIGRYAFRDLSVTGEPTGGVYIEGDPKSGRITSIEPAHSSGYRTVDATGIQTGELLLAAYKDRVGQCSPDFSDEDGDSFWCRTEFSKDVMYGVDVSDCKENLFIRPEERSKFRFSLSKTKIRPCMKIDAIVIERR